MSWSRRPRGAPCQSPSMLYQREARLTHLEGLRVLRTLSAFIPRTRWIMTYCSRRHGRRLGRNAAVTVLGAAPVSIPSRIVSISADIYGLDVVAELTLSWLSLWLNSQ